MQPGPCTKEVSEWAIELLGALELEDMLVRRRRNVEAVGEGIVRRDLYFVSPSGVA